jgi:hypothetical protein
VVRLEHMHVEAAILVAAAPSPAAASGRFRCP